MALAKVIAIGAGPMGLAAWIWTRIKRVGSSRKSIMQEELGYLGGGSKTLIDVLAAAIEAKGGRIHLGSSAQQVTVANDSVVGVQTKTAFFTADHVISTIPTPNISRLVPDLPEEWRARYEALKTIGICCLQTQALGQPTLLDKSRINGS